MDSTTTLEAAVFLVACVTEFFAMWSLFVSHTDHLVLRRLQENGLKHLTLTARLVRDIARVCCASVILAASVACLHLPPDYDEASIVLKTALLLVSLFLALAVIMDFRWRRLIDKALEAAELAEGRR